MRLIRSDIYENLKMALSTLRANKLRSFLTVTGVMIGVITVMLISSIISGVDTAVKTELESYGTNSIYVIKFNSGIHIGRLSREERMRKELTYDDAIALQQWHRDLRHRYDQIMSDVSQQDRTFRMTASVLGAHQPPLDLLSNHRVVLRDLRHRVTPRDVDAAVSDVRGVKSSVLNNDGRQGRRHPP